MSSLYLSRSQAALRVGRSRKTLRKLQERGLGPRVIMIGDRPAYPASDLEAWLADGGDQ